MSKLKHLKEQHTSLGEGNAHDACHLQVHCIHTVQTHPAHVVQTVSGLAPMVHGSLAGAAVPLGDAHMLRHSPGATTVPAG